MKVVLVSRDEDLYRCCRASLAGLDEFSRPELVLAGAAPQTDADFYIWDYSPRLNLQTLMRTANALCASKVTRTADALCASKVTRTANALCASKVTRTANALCASTFDEGDHHLVLVDRQDLPDASLCLPPGVPLTIKPVSVVTLAGWMKRVSACRRERKRQDSQAEGLHDFGPPLTAVSGYCDLLLADAIDPLTDRQRAILDRMRNSAARLTRLRWEMSERNRGRDCLAPMQAASIELCIDQAIHEIQILADKKHVTIAAEIIPPREIYFDRSQVEQVCCNLLENACKFAHEGGRIEIRGYPLHARNCFRVDVFNTGPAIPPEHLERIFDDYTSFGSRGTGLGLAISKRIIERHGGNIWAENRQKGPAISFVLPLAAFNIDRAPGDARQPILQQSYRKPLATVPA